MNCVTRQCEDRGLQAHWCFVMDFLDEYSRTSKERPCLLFLSFLVLIQSQNHSIGIAMALSAHLIFRPRDGSLDSIQGVKLFSRTIQYSYIYLFYVGAHQPPPGLITQSLRNPGWELSHLPSSPKTFRFFIHRYDAPYEKIVVSFKFSIGLQKGYSTQSSWGYLEDINGGHIE